jgi:FkbM family methyltransferase
MSRADLLDAYSFLFARKPFYTMNRWLFHASARGLGILNWKNAVASGERNFLRTYLGKIDNPVVVDFGANEGDYSADVLGFAKSGRVFAFEPNPATYSRLFARSRELKSLTPVNAACGSSPGRLQLYDYAGSQGTGHASLYPGVIEKIHKGKSQSVEVDVITLDDFAAGHGISTIDLLKIDVEGHELEVLKGATNLLAQARIKAIHFEFNEMNIVSHVFLKDFMDMLPGYRFNRMLRDGLVELTPYWPIFCELFAFQNIVALSPAAHP